MPARLVSGDVDSFSPVVIGIAAAGLIFAIGCLGALFFAARRYVKANPAVEPDDTSSSRQVVLFLKESISRLNFLIES